MTSTPRPWRRAITSAVWRVRERSLDTIRSNRTVASSSATASAWRRPRSVSGESDWPAKRRAAFASLSPWRTK